jgi:hypothetical protein
MRRAVLLVLSVCAVLGNLKIRREYVWGEYSLLREVTELLSEL